MPIIPDRFICWIDCALLGVHAGVRVVHRDQHSHHDAQHIALLPAAPPRGEREQQQQYDAHPDEQQPGTSNQRHVYNTVVRRGHERQPGDGGHRDCVRRVVHVRVPHPVRKVCTFSIYCPVL